MSSVEKTPVAALALTSIFTAGLLGGAVSVVFHLSGNLNTEGFLYHFLVIVAAAIGVVLGLLLGHRSSITYEGFMHATRSLRSTRESVERLNGEIKGASLRLERYVLRLPKSSEPPWATAANGHLQLAAEYANAGYITAGYESLFAAERDLVAGMSTGERRNRAVSLRAEAQKLGQSWRATATAKLLGNGTPLVSVSALQEAMAHVQYRSQNSYRKIDLLKRQLTILGSLLGLLVGAIVLFASMGSFIELDSHSDKWMGLAVLFGLLGGALSAMISVTHTPSNVKIPDAQRSGSLTLVRALLGAAAAIPIYVFMRSGLIEFTAVASPLAPILAFSFLGGFSERWFLSKMEQVSGVKHGPDTAEIGEGTTSPTAEAPDNVTASGFRAGIGIVVVSAAGKVLQCQRADVAAPAWQFLQGGIEADETLVEAAKREIEEEIGVTYAHLELAGEVPDWLSYELPPKMQNDKVGRGQSQKWFLFRMTADGEAQIELNEEFSEFRWVSMQQAVDDVVEFRKQVYQRLQKEFADIVGE